MIADSSGLPIIPRGEIWLEKYYLPEKDAVLAAFRRKRIWTKKFGYEKAKSMMRQAGNASDAQTVERSDIAWPAGYRIRLVDGRKIRAGIDPNFCFGGHWKVYGYVPEGHVWIDDAVTPAERKYVIVHELHELDLMLKGKSYNDAHDHANAAEKEARRADGAKYPKD